MESEVYYRCGGSVAVVNCGNVVVDLAKGTVGEMMKLLSKFRKENSWDAYYSNERAYFYGWMNDWGFASGGPLCCDMPLLTGRVERESGAIVRIRFWKPEKYGHCSHISEFIGSVKRLIEVEDSEKEVLEVGEDIYRILIEN